MGVKTPFLLRIGKHMLTIMVRKRQIFSFFRGWTLDELSKIHGVNVNLSYLKKKKKTRESLLRSFSSSGITPKFYMIHTWMGEPILNFQRSSSFCDIIVLTSAFL